MYINEYTSHAKGVKLDQFETIDVPSQNAFPLKIEILDYIGRCNMPLKLRSGYKF